MSSEFEVDLRVDTDSENYDSDAAPGVKMTKQTKLVTTVQDKDTEEPWVRLKYHPRQSDISARYLEKMVEVHGSSNLFHMSPYDYLKAMCPGGLSESDQDKAPPRCPRVWTSESLEEYIKSRLCEGPIHRYNTLAYLGLENPEDKKKWKEEIYRILKEHAISIQGLWVPKSRLVYGTDRGIKVLARSYVIYLFSKAPTIKKSVLKDDTVFEHLMEGVLNELGVERPLLKDWKLKESPDYQFLKDHQELAQQQAENHERVGERLLEAVARVKRKIWEREASQKKGPEGNTGKG